MPTKNLINGFSIACLVVSGFANSQSIPVLNHTFEFDTIPLDTQKTNSISGWQSPEMSRIGVELPLGGGIAYEGFTNVSQAAFLEKNGRMSQSLNIPLQKGETYSLSYLVGRPLGALGHNLVARVKANGLTLAQKQTHATDVNEGDWANINLTFMATENMPIGSLLSLEFYNPESPLGAKVHLDAIKFELAETSTLPTQNSGTRISVLNHNYESDNIPFDTGRTTHISGWASTGNGIIGVEFPDGAGIDYVNSTSAGQMAYLEKGGRISQALDIDLEHGETYTLSYLVGRPIGEPGHSLIARLKSEGLVLAQKHTRSDDVEPGKMLVQTLSFKATEVMPLGKPLVVELYNPPTTAAAKVNIDSIQINLAGTGEVISPAIPLFANQVTNDVVHSDLTINVPQDFNDVNRALDYLNDKIIHPNSTVTIRTNFCNDDYDQPIHVHHAQGGQIELKEGDASCGIRFSGNHGLVVSTALKSIPNLRLYGQISGTGTGITLNDGAIIKNAPNAYVQHFDTGIKLNAGTYFSHSGTSRSNKLYGYHSQFGALLDSSSSRIDRNQTGSFTSNNGIIQLGGYIYSRYNTKPDLISADAGYQYLTSPATFLYTNNARNLISDTFSNIDFFGSFSGTPSNERIFFSSHHSSWFHLNNLPHDYHFNNTNAGYFSRP